MWQSNKLQNVIVQILRVYTTLEIYSEAHSSLFELVMNKLHDIGVSYFKTYVKNHPIQISLDRIALLSPSTSDYQIQKDNTSFIPQLKDENTLNIMSKMILFAQVSYCELKLKHNDTNELQTQQQPILSHSQDTITETFSRTSSLEICHQAKKVKIGGYHSCASVLDELLNSTNEKEILAGQYILTILIIMHPESKHVLQKLMNKIEEMFYSSDFITSELGSACLKHLINFEANSSSNITDVSLIADHIILKLRSTTNFLNFHHLLDLLTDLIIYDILSPQNVLDVFNIFMGCSFECFLIEDFNGSLSFIKCFKATLNRMKPLTKSQIHEVFKYIFGLCKIKSGNRSSIFVFNVVSSLFSNQNNPPNGPMLRKSFPIMEERFLFEFKAEELNLKAIQCFKRQIFCELNSGERPLKRNISTSDFVWMTTDNSFLEFRKSIALEMEKLLEFRIDDLSIYTFSVYKWLILLQQLASGRFKDILESDIELNQLIESLINPFVLNMNSILDDERIIEYLFNFKHASPGVHLLWPAPANYTKKVVLCLLQKFNLKSRKLITPAPVLTPASRNINIFEMSSYGTVIGGPNEFKKYQKMEASLKIIINLINPCLPLNEHNDKHIIESIELLLMNILKFSSNIQIRIISETLFPILMTQKLLTKGKSYYLTDKLALPKY